MNLDKLKIWYRDWRRGYTDADIRSLDKKVRAHKRAPGAILKLTTSELKAYRDSFY